MRMLWHLSSIAVSCNFSFVFPSNVRIGQIINIIPDSQYHLIRHQSLIHQIQHQNICHFPHDQSCLVIIIGTVKDLPGTDTVCLWFISFDICNCTWLPAPGMVYEKFRVDSKYFVEQVFIIIFIGFSKRTSGNISHGIQPYLFQLLRIASAHSPEIRNRLMPPQ